MGALTVLGLAPAGGQGVDVGAADAAVRDLDVDVVLGPLLGLVLSPLHVALNGLGVVPEPALELVVGHGVGCGIDWFFLRSVVAFVGWVCSEG